MSSTHKRVVVRKFDRESISGYIGDSFVADHCVQMMNISGKVVSVPLPEVKGVYIVRSWEEPEEIVRKSFPSRPRSEGLWVRLVFKDNEMLEGLMAGELTQQGAEGFLITPPDTRGNTQRVFVPRSALQSLTVLAVIGNAQSRLKKRPASVGTEQPELFASAE